MIKKSILPLLILITLWIFTPLHALAATTVPASNDTSGGTDYSNIMNALETDGNVILENGSTYYIKTMLWVESNQSITATGATIISNSGAFRNKPTSTNYDSIQNFVVDGGTWINKNKDGFDKSMIQFSHCSNITLKNLKVECNYKGHAVELIACKDVTVNNCTLQGIGKCPKDSVEEQLQIDLATPITAPTIKSYGSKFVQGQTCKNITVENCTITGARGLCCNYASKEKKYQNRFHENIVLKNNKITGKSGEAVALFNVMGATVTGNKITCNSTRTNTAYSVGCHIAMFGKSPSGMSKAVYKVSGNTIKGGRQGFYVYSHTSSKFGKVVAKNNKCYAKSSKDKAILVPESCVSNITLDKNKLNKWN